MRRSPVARHLLNAIAYAHLIPCIDGGIAAGLKPDGTPLHVDWRIQTVGPDNVCLVCMDALRRSDIALDIDGRLDDPDCIEQPAGERADSLFATQRLSVQFECCRARGIAARWSSDRV
jgi:hypothetical protein